MYNAPISNIKEIQNIFSLFPGYSFFLSILLKLLFFREKKLNWRGLNLSSYPHDFCLALKCLHFWDNFTHLKMKTTDVTFLNLKFIVPQNLSFKNYKIVDFSIFTKLCNYHHQIYIIPLSLHTKKTHYTLVFTLYFYL